MRYDNPVFRIMGDRGLLAELGDRIHPEINQSVQELHIGLGLRQIQGVVDLVPSYRPFDVYVEDEPQDSKQQIGKGNLRAIVS